MTGSEQPPEESLADDNKTEEGQTEEGQTEEGQTEEGQTEEGLPPKLEGGMAAGFGGVRRPPSSGILDRLAATSGIKSRVLLREEPGHPAPLLRPGDGSAPAAGKYAVQGEIARGGVGIVLKGHDNDLGRDVALKFLRSKYCDNGSILQRFVEEAQIGGQLQHPGIVPVYDVGIADGKPFFTMKLIKGRTLAALLEEREDPGRGRRKFLDIFEAMCQTMAYAHARGVIHRDLKPANVMVGAFGEVQVVDWGMAKVLPHGGSADERKLAHAQSSVSIIETVRSQETAQGSQSVVGSVMGTPPYMPPEQARGDVEHMDERSDVFALGAVLCEILTGQPPYVGEAEDLVAMAANCATEDARQRLALCGADQVLIKLSEECLCPAPAARPRSAAVLADRIAEHLQSVEERAHQAQIDAAEARVKATAERKARKLTVGLAASVLLTVGLVIGGYYWSEAEARDRRRATEQKIASALVDATVARGLEDWPAAVAAAQRAKDLLSDEVGPDIHTRVREKSGEIEQAATLAAAQKQIIARNERLLGTLADVRQPEGDHIYLVDWLQLASAYRDTFRADELDLLSGTEQDAARAIRARGVPVGLAAYVDTWAQAASRARQKENAARLTRIANLADGDETRRELRQAFTSGDTDKLKKFADREDLRTWPPQTLNLLGGALLRKGAKKTALTIYQLGQRTHPTDFALNMGLGMALKQRPKPRSWEASRFFQVAFALRPESVEVRHQLGMALTAQKNERSKREALELFRDALKRNPQDGHTWFHVGQCHNFLLEEEKAVVAYRESIRLDPDFRIARHNLARVLRYLGRFEEAAVQLAEAIRLAPDADHLHSERVGVLEQLGRFEEIVSIYSKLAAADLDKTEYQAQLACGLHRQGKNDEAIVILRRAVQRDNTQGNAWRLLAYLLEQVGRKQEALLAARRAIVLTAKKPRLLGGAALVLASLGHPEEALVELRKALECEGYKARVHFAMARILRTQGKIEDALREYREAISHEPRILHSFRENGQFACVLAGVGEFAEAIGVFRTAIQLEGASAMLHSNLGVCLYECGKLDDAMVELQAALRLDSKMASAYNGIGNIHRARGELEAAAGAYRKCFELDPNRLAARYNFGLVLQRQGKLVAAVQAYREIIRLDDKYVDAHAGLGGALLEQGLLADALQSLREAIRLDPSSAYAQGNLGNCLSELGKLAEAEAALRKAVKLDPNSGLSAHNLGVVLGRMEKWDEAEIQSRTAIRLGYRNAVAYASLGRYLLKQGKLAEAETALRKRTTLEPKSAEAVYRLGIVLAKQKKFVEAVASFRSAIRLGYKGPAAHLNVGINLYNMRKVNAAAREFQHAARIDPNCVAAYRWLGFAWTMVGKHRAAEAACRQVLELQPGDIPTHVRLGSILALLGRHKESIRVLRKAVRLDPARPESLSKLGSALLFNGRAEEAVPLFEKAHAIGSKRSDWRYPSAQWLEEAQKQAKREARLLEIVHDKTTAKDATEAAEAALLAYRRDWYLASVRLTRDAFQKDTSLAANLVKYYRYNGACAAALAAAGRGEDAGGLTAKERTSFRAQVLTWLHEELVALRLQADYDLARALKHLRHSQTDPDLAVIRDSEAITKLDKNEQARCRAFWNDVQALILKLEARSEKSKKSEKGKKNNEQGKRP